MSSNIYRSITTLPLSRFIDVVVDENLFAIVISGKPSEQELVKAWDDIRMQYAEAMKDSEYRMLTSIIRDYQRISITYDQIQIAIQELTVRYVPQFAQKLNRWLNTSMKFDVRFPDDYDKDLKRAKNMSNGVMLDLKIQKASYDAAIKRREQFNSKPTREYFERIKITFENHWRFPMKESMTTFEFCERVTRLNSELESLKNTRQWQRKKI